MVFIFMVKKERQAVKSILLIEDDKSISDLLEIHLKDMEFSVVKEYNGEKGLNQALFNNFDLIVLDIMLPRLDGIEICKQLRKKENYTPILMLTSKSEEFDRVLGLEIGADDYLTKPFSIREFIARVKAIFRRVENIRGELEEEKEITAGSLKIEPSKTRVLLKEKRIELTPKEFELLYLLASHPGRTYTREQLLNQIWGDHYNGFEHTVNSHINRLRSKIEEDLSNPTYILTTWGIGYRFNEDAVLQRT